MPLGELGQVVTTCNSTLSIQYFCKHGSRRQAGKRCQVNGRLGRRRASQYTPSRCRNREDVSRLNQIGWLTECIDRHLNRSRPIRCRYTGVNARSCLNRQREGRKRVIALHHQRQLKLLATLGCQSQTHQATCLTRHKSNMVCLTMLCCRHHKTRHSPRAVVVQQEAALPVPQLAE